MPFVLVSPRMRPHRVHAAHSHRFHGEREWIIHLKLEGVHLKRLRVKKVRRIAVDALSMHNSTHRRISIRIWQRLITWFSIQQFINVLQ